MILLNYTQKAKDDKHGGYEDAVHSGALDDWAVLFITMLDAAYLYLRILHIKVQQAAQKIKREKIK